jgi:hypothetical protein
MKKNRLNRLEFLKNQPVRFWFYKPETEKTKPNQTQTEKTEPNKKKPSQIGFCQKNRTEPKPVGLNRFRFF